MQFFKGNISIIVHSTKSNKIFNGEAANDLVLPLSNNKQLIVKDVLMTESESQWDHFPYTGRTPTLSYLIQK